MFNKIVNMLKNCATNDSVFPSTELYNEGWMVRIIVDWFSNYSGNQHLFSFIPESKWYSEALLPTAFRAMTKGDVLAESMARVDAVIGNFNVGNFSKVDLLLENGAEQFLVIEAKMFSKLDSGTKNAKNYDQASRYVACMAETLKRTEIKPDNFEKLGFYVIAPLSQIEKEETFKRYTDIANIEYKVSERVEAYLDREDYNEKKDWFDEWFIPMLDKIDIQYFSWEEIIEFIIKEDKYIEYKILEFYGNCIRYNQ